MNLLSIILAAICWCSPTGLEQGPDGRLYLAYEAREEKGSKFVKVVSSGDEGASWADAVTFREKDAEVESAVLWRDLTGALRMFCTVTAEDGAPALMSSAMLPDGRWSALERAGEGKVCSRPVMMRSGMMVLGVQRPGGDSGTLVSMDRGASWFPSRGTVHMEEKIRDGGNRPVLMPYRSGRLALFSSAHGYEWRYRSLSQDFGQTWSAPERDFMCPFTGSSLTLLPSGRWLLVKNGRIDQRLCYVPDRLYAYISDDEGATWYGGMRLDDRVDAVNPVCCAPGGGRIYIAWAYCPEDGHASEIRLVRTGEPEIGNSTLAASLAPASVITAVDANKEAQRVYNEWYRRATSTKGSWAKEPLRVASYNIEYVSKKAGVPAWERRLEYVNWLFREYDFDVVGVQEPWAPEYEDLRRTLGDRWDSIVACTNLEGPGFQNAIFWKRDRVEKLDDGVFWYTENPGRPGGFGGRSSRLCIWAKFRDRETGKIFYNFNSHFDFISGEAALMSSRLLLTKVREIAGEYPAFLTGDYNSSDGTPAMKWISGSSFMADSKTYSDKAENAEFSTVRSYKEKVPVGKSQIDHIFVSVGKTRVKRWKLIMDTHNGLYGGSDHMPIMIEWLISN